MPSTRFTSSACSPRSAVDACRPLVVVEHAVRDQGTCVADRVLVLGREVPGRACRGQIRFHPFPDIELTPRPVFDRAQLSATDEQLTGERCSVRIGRRGTELRGAGVVHPSERGPELPCRSGRWPTAFEAFEFDGVFAHRDHLYDRRSRRRQPAQPGGFGREEVGMTAPRAALAQRLGEGGTHREECSSVAVASRLFALTRASRSKRSLATRIAISYGSANFRAHQYPNRMSNEV